ncbi:hypothetical protein MUG91_G95n147 [Manis pentadactyla]|nr:hypothetical protein MUG91_G95n147 [Manis pentadactyla]
MRPVWHLHFSRSKKKDVKPSTAIITEDTSLPQRQSTEEMEPSVELQELVTVKDEEMDFTSVEEEELNSAQRYRGVDRKMENCGSFVLWDPDAAGARAHWRAGAEPATGEGAGRAAAPRISRQQGKNNFQEIILLITFIIDLTLKFHIEGKSTDFQLMVENL